MVLKEVEVPSGSQFSWESDIRLGNKKVLKKSKIPDGRITYNNPGQHTFEYSDAKDVREFVKKKIGGWGQMGGAAQQLFSNGQHITESTSWGSPITDIIKQQDSTFKAEAQGNDQALQMLTKLRTELNTSNMNQFFQQAMNGQMNNIQSLMGGQLMGIFTQMLALAQQTGTRQNQESQQNKANSNIQAVDANGHIITIT